MKLTHLVSCAAMALSAAVFAEDAYVQSDGTQCLGVDFQPTEVTRYEVDFQMTTASAQGNVAILGWEPKGVKLGLSTTAGGKFEAPYGNNPDNSDW